MPAAALGAHVGAGATRGDGEAAGEVVAERDLADAWAAVSYTHLTLPTTPYV